MNKRQEDIKKEINFHKNRLVKLNSEIKSTNSVINELERPNGIYDPVERLAIDVVKKYRIERY